MNKLTSERYSKFRQASEYYQSYMYVIPAPATWQRPLVVGQVRDLCDKPRPSKYRKRFLLQNIVWSVFLSFPTAGTGRRLIVIVLCMCICVCVCTVVCPDGGRGLDIGERLAPRPTPAASSSSSNRTFALLLRRLRQLLKVSAQLVLDRVLEKCFGNLIFFTKKYTTSLESLLLKVSAYYL